jgi:hypothetical protein
MKKLQEVWIPATVIDRLDHDYLGYAKKIVFPHMVYTFTPEELKTFLENYTKRIVENAILKEKKISYPCSSGIEYGYVTLVDKKSITDQLEILKKELNL